MHAFLISIPNNARPVPGSRKSGQILKVTHFASVVLCASSMLAAQSSISPISSANSNNLVAAKVTQVQRSAASSATTTAPTLTVNPSSIAFGSVNTGSLTSRSVTLTNPSTGGSAATTVTFDSPVPPGSSDSALTGTFQGINFGSGGWFWGGSFAADGTRNIYFSSSSAKSGSFSFATAQLFNGLKISTGTAGALTLSDNQGQTKSVSVPAGSFVTVSTGWSKPSTKVTVTFSAGWEAVFDDLSYGSAATGSGQNIIVSSLTPSGTGFKVSGLTVPATIAPGNSVSFQVGYSPKATGSSTGSVLIRSNAANVSATVALSGTGVTATAHLATIAWKASTSSVSGYNIYRSTSSGGTYVKLNSSLVNADSYTDSSVAAGATYYYAITSVTSAGVESNYSNVAAVTVPTP